MADKHVITELPLVPFVIINLTSLTAGVCMKVRFKFKVTTSRLAFAASRLSHAGKKSRKTSGTRVTFRNTKVKSDHTSKFSNLSNWKEEA